MNAVLEWLDPEEDDEGARKTENRKGQAAMTRGTYLVTRFALAIIFVIAFLVFGWPGILLMAATSLVYLWVDMTSGK